MLPRRMDNFVGYRRHRRMQRVELLRCVWCRGKRAYGFSEGPLRRFWSWPNLRLCGVRLVALRLNAAAAPELAKYRDSVRAICVSMQARTDSWMALMWQTRSMFAASLPIMRARLAIRPAFSALLLFYQCMWLRMVFGFAPYICSWPLRFLALMAIEWLLEKSVQRRKSRMTGDLDPYSTPVHQV